MNLKISDQKARELYKTGSIEVKLILEESFGKGFFSMDITDRIKSYEDACEYLGIKPIDEDKLMSFGLTTQDIAYQKMCTIVKALNEEWVPDVCDSNVYRYYPYFCTNGSPSAFAFDFSFCDSSRAAAGSGSRLALKSVELSDYCGTQFINLWKQFIL